MPGGVGDTKLVMRYIAEEISPNTYVNVMAQYHPEVVSGDGLMRCSLA